MRVMAQMAMVMNLTSASLGHDCTVTCKQVRPTVPASVRFSATTLRPPGIGLPEAVQPRTRNSGTGLDPDKKGRL